MAVAPESMPVLSRGKHRNPARGACFLEYTSLLAGEPFSDAPACVDRELAAVLRQANDLLANRERGRLVPLLGRAIGLAVLRPAAPRDEQLDAGDLGSGVGSCAHVLEALHRAVSARFLAAVGVEPTPGEMRRFDDGREVERLFWRLLHEPVRARGREAFLDRLVARLVLLHACYEQAMVDLGLPRHVVRRPEPAAVPTRQAPAQAPEQAPMA